MFGLNKYDAFWAWFVKNSDKLFGLDNFNDKITDDLHNQLHKVDGNLTFEIGPKNDTQREFIISADGIIEAFPAVEELYNEKPELGKWEIIKFRQRGDIDSVICINEVTLNPNDIRYLLFPHDGKIGLYLYIKNYSSNENTYKNMAYIFLDNALGEYDVETKIGGIRMSDYDTDYFENSKEIKSFRDDFDEMWVEIGN